MFRFVIVLFVCWQNIKVFLEETLVPSTEHEVKPTDCWLNADVGYEWSSVRTTFSFACVCVSCAKLASFHLHLACQCSCYHNIFLQFYSPAPDWFWIVWRNHSHNPLTRPHSLLSPLPSFPSALSFSTPRPFDLFFCSLSSTSHSVALLFFLLRSAPPSLVLPALTVKRKSAQEDVCVLQSREGNSWHSSSGSGGGGELSLALTPIKMSLLPSFLLLLFLLLRPA